MTTDLRPLPMTVRENPRAKRIIMKLLPGAGLEVVTPRGLRRALVTDMLESRRDWIARTATDMAAQGRSPWPEPPAVPEEVRFPAIDRTHPVRHVIRPGRVSLTQNAGSLMLAGNDEAALLERLRDFVRTTARESLPERLRTMSRELNLPFESVTIRSQRRRWGSCSSRGRISLNCKTLFLTPELAEHLMLHELCHLKHPDHSPAYWKLVARHQPDFKRLETDLRDAMRLVPGWMEATPHGSADLFYTFR
ncbi:M48 family metallopeptidase [Salidesulfovibrio brasiliensis]|uniref:M48 family metallopeptidase n=1 Tax=Salidesulfovibrio brasiliensis TaxID=221711 RepID=UPI0006D1A6AA|nr:SprT family zinc-dependent metalloprotease [Salidesulfovibrio brasiliensis]